MTIIPGSSLSDWVQMMKAGGMVLIEKIKTWAKQGKGRDKRGRPLEFYGFLDSFPDGSIGKEPSYNAGDAGTIPWS